MQAALQDGAATSRPVSYPCAGARFSMVRAWAAADIAREIISGSAATKHFIFIFGVLDCGPSGHLSHQMLSLHQIRTEIIRPSKFGFGKTKFWFTRGAAQVAAS
jgi:hypothetical protein